MGELESLCDSLVVVRELWEGVWDGAELLKHMGKDGKGQRTVGDAVRGIFQSQRESFSMSMSGKAG